MAECDGLYTLSPLLCYPTNLEYNSEIVESQIFLSVRDWSIAEGVPPLRGMERKRKCAKPDPSKARGMP